jgi:hypothetical protein
VARAGDDGLLGVRDGVKMKSRRKGIIDTAPAVGPPQTRKARRRRFERLMNRWSLTIAVLIIVVLLSLIALIELLWPSAGTNLRNGRSISRGYFYYYLDLFLLVMLWTMRSIGMADHTIKFVLLSITALCLMGLGGIVFFLWRRAPKDY